MFFVILLAAMFFAVEPVSAEGFRPKPQDEEKVVAGGENTNIAVRFFKVEGCVNTEVLVFASDNAEFSKVDGFDYKLSGASVLVKVSNTCTQEVYSYTGGVDIPFEGARDRFDISVMPRTLHLLFAELRVRNEVWLCSSGGVCFPVSLNVWCVATSSTTHEWQEQVTPAGYLQKSYFGFAYALCGANLKKDSRMMLTKEKEATLNHSTYKIVEK